MGVRSLTGSASASMGSGEAESEQSAQFPAAAAAGPHRPSMNYRCDTTHITRGIVDDPSIRRRLLLQLLSSGPRTSWEDTESKKGARAKALDDFSFSELHWVSDT